MFDNILEWVVIGLVLVNLIALVNWHRIMHHYIKNINRSVINLNKLLMISKFGIMFVNDEEDDDTVNKVAETLVGMTVEEWDNA